VRFGKLRLRAILALLVLTTSVPLGLFAGILIVRSSHEQRALVEQRNVETARAVSVAVDQQVESARAALQALAATDLLTTPERITFMKRRCGSFRRNRAGMRCCWFIRPAP
jgi:sensor histidine kinase regulating citrate/malate metabolism